MGDIRSCHDCQHRKGSAVNSIPLEFDKCKIWFLHPANVQRLNAFKFCSTINHSLDCPNWEKRASIWQRIKGWFK